MALPLLVSAEDATPAPGSIVVSFQTQPYNGKYSPRHVLAVWVVDASEKHVRTLAVYGKRYAKKLGRLRKAVGRIETDAITGPTRRQHEALKVVWDGKDEDGKVVPDGDYKVRFEYTETNKLGPAFEIAIKKGGKQGAEQPQGSKYITDITVETVGPKAN
jgi:hypothetical protein